MIELRGITKRFSTVVANDGINLSIEPGEIHAILGENGAGKSTLMGVLFGIYEPTAGSILIDGQRVEITSPVTAIAHGLGMVHQHFMLVPTLTIWENVVLGSEPSNFGVLAKSAARKRVLELSERYGLGVDPDALVDELPVGVQQRVEILKALNGDARCLILDEPTAVLTPSETGELFGVLKALRASGRSVIFISHKLNEVLEIADRITVLRQGRVIGTATPADSTPRSLASMMVGKAIELAVEKTESTPGATALRVGDVVIERESGSRLLDGVSFEVREGEIFGIAGVQGNGQTELVEAITGLRQITSGTICLDGEDVSSLGVRTLTERGMAHIPEDRQRVGLVLSFSIKDNLTLKAFYKEPFAVRGVIDRERVASLSRRLVEEYDVRCTSIEEPCASLSGGNQQKVIVAREFGHARRLLVASQPTRGLDVSATRYVHEQLVSKRDGGAGVLLVSTELDEVFELSDRIGVMYEGRLISVLDRRDATFERVGLLMAGHEGQSEAQPARVDTGG